MPTLILTRLTYLPIILICLTVHEAGHGLAAYLLGDKTAKQSGRLSLNPLRHIDPIGLLMMLLFGFGWARPVPVDPSRFKHPKTGMALTALAGPLTNILTAAVLSLIMPLFHSPVAQWLQTGIEFSIGLAAFNLIPIPPLDGSRILMLILPEKLAWKWASLDRYGWVILMIASYAGLLNAPINAIQTAIIRLLSLLP